MILGNPHQRFNPAAFLAPPNASGFYGNPGRGTLEGPDSGLGSLLKNSAIRESLNSQFRAEVFNPLNRISIRPTQ